jgi:outer membrane protein assembly factor BamB
MRYRLSGRRIVLPTLLGLLGTVSWQPGKASPAVPPPNLLQLRAQYGLTPEAEKMLLQNGFLVLDQARYKTLGDAYPQQHHITPMYVTTDAMLALWASLHRSLLESAERQICAKQLSTLLPAFETRAKTLYETASEEKERAALRQVLVTFAVARRLMLPTSHAPAYTPAVQAEIDTQVQKVMAHQEANDYPGEDYTQYTVRGHYADDPALSRYFRASLWLSRHFFAVTPEAGGDPNAGLRAAVVCAAVARSAAPEAQSALIRLVKLRETLAGPADAVSLSQLIAALDRAVGVGWPLKRALLPASLAALRRELARPLYPVGQVRTRIVNEMGAAFPVQTVATLPGIAAPDSVLFRQTVHPAIAKRSLPSGLEVAASLGFEAARREIEQQEGPRAKEVLAAVDRYGTRLQADDGTTLISGWLHALSTLATVPKGAPEFMQNPAWRVEKLNTTLASWAQLRHNFLLYAEQNYAMTQGMQMQAPALVEANPAFYQAMAQLADRTLRLFQTAGGLDPKQAKALAAYATQCRAFAIYASAELSGTLTLRQSAEIDGFGAWLDRAYTGGAAAMVADVATGMAGETSTETRPTVLHAATGDLRTLLVIPDPKTGVVYTGAVQSYYEFPRKGLERLTDARWQAQQSQSYLRPESPAWAYAFMAQEAGPEWQARESLRAAEKLLVENRTEEALALLRATVTNNPDTALATEAQFRLGRFYFEKQAFAQAEQELRRCEHLPGCTAFDQAQALLRQLKAAAQSRDYRERIGAPAQAKMLAELKRLQEAVAALRRTPADPSRERLLAQSLIRRVPWEESRNVRQADFESLLSAARAACRTQACQDALGYALLIVRRGGRHGVGSEAQIAFALAFAHQAVSPPLRAAALSLALEDGYLTERPQAALTLLRPFLDTPVVINNADPALLLILAQPDQTSSLNANASFTFRANPIELFRTQIAKTLATLASSALDAGQIRQAVHYARLYPSGPSEIGRGDESELQEILQAWGSIPDAELPAASMLAVQGGLERTGGTAAMAVQAQALVRRFPRSRYALYALCRTIRRSAYDANTAQGDLLKTLVSRDYPESLPALCIAIDAACRRGDVEGTRRLLAEFHTRTKDKNYASTYHPDDDPIGVESIEYSLVQNDLLTKQLKPLLDAAHAPELVRLDRPERTGEALAEALIRRLPDRAAEIYLTLSGIYKNPTLTMRFLERFPADPQSGEAWKRLVGEERSVTPGALHSSGPKVVMWLAPFVNRDDVNSAAAVKLLRRAMRDGSGEAGIRSAQEEARLVEGRYPRSRASAAANLAVAQTLLDSHRPEAMAPYADRAMAVLQKDDALYLEAEQLRRRAGQEIAAKHRQEWHPLWEATLRRANSDSISEEPVPAVAFGLLLAPEPDARGIRQLTALDTTTAAQKWTSHLESSLLDFIAPPGGHSIYCVEANGVVVALDAQTGQQRWQQKGLAGQKGAQWDGITGTAHAIVVYGAKVDRRGEHAEDDAVGVIGLSPEDGHTLWHHPDWRLTRAGRKVQGKPAVLKEHIVVALENPTQLVAFQPGSGAVVWKHPYPDPDLSDPRGGGRRPIPTLLFQPQAVDDGHLVVFTFRPSRHYELLDGPTDAVLKTIAPMPSLTTSTGFFAAEGYFVEWDFNGGSSVRRIRDLTTLPTRFGLRGMQTTLPIAEHVLYLCDPQNAKLAAIDLETGASLATGSSLGADFGSMTVVGENKVFVIGYNGKVTAFPLFTR